MATIKSIEEKAKRYDEVVNKLKGFMARGVDPLITRADVQDFFSELAESDDEKIRESLLEYLHTLPNHYAHSGVCAPEWIAWIKKQGDANKEYWRGYREGKQEILDKYFEIEKQGEQKPADKVEPKFKPDDWVFIEEVKEHKNGPFQIKTVDYFGYSFDEYHTIPFMYKEILSKWTITDAKDGDVLADSEKNIILMFKGIGNTEWDDVIDYHCYYDCHKKSFIIQEDVEYLGNREDNQLKPATKEQRDTIIKAIADAGYTFDFEKKELKKIEKNPAWSEEDESHIKRIIEHFEGIKKDLKTQWVAELHNKEIDWLKSLKDRVQPQQKERSEEDEEILDKVITNYESGYLPSVEKRDEIIKKLKSLKERCTWKPSDEQMDVLLSEVTAWTKGCPKQIVLESLYQDLKKLRKE